MSGGGAKAQFDDFTVSEVYCPRCRMSRPVRQRLLLVLPDGELHEYFCSVCSESLATRKTSLPPVAMRSEPPRRSRRGG